MKIHKYAAKAIFRDSDDYVLVLRRSGTHPFVPHTADIPGGTLDSGEDSISALRRELIEEIGIDITQYSTVFIGSQIVGRFGRKIQADLYEITGFEQRPTVVLSSEHDQYEWVPLSQLTHIGSFESLINIYIQKQT